MNIFERMADFNFRIAAGNEKKRRIYSVVTAILFVGLLLLFFLAGVLTDKWLNLPSINYFPWTFVLALILIAVGLIPTSWSLIQFMRNRGSPVPTDPPRKLITTGLYSYCRNPMLLGAFLILFGISILIGSLSATVFYIPLLIVLLYLQVVKVEEKDMELKFGREYLEYKSRVPRFIPRINKQ